VPISEKLFIGGNLNEHVVSIRLCFDGVHIGFFKRISSLEREYDFTLTYNLIIMNTLFRKIV
jgi:hypothetical protein